jgi:hypothetical protein
MASSSHHIWREFVFKFKDNSYGIILDAIYKIARQITEAVRRAKMMLRRSK